MKVAVSAEVKWIPSGHICTQRPILPFKTTSWQITVPTLPLLALVMVFPSREATVRYFGGDLHLLSMEGHGTDAFVYLKRLGNSSEP